jgi:hypothetical protein
MWQTAILQFATLSLLVASALLWMRSKSVWMLLALVAQAASIVVGYVPLTRGLFVYPLFRFSYPVVSAVFAVGLTAYAWNEYTASKQRAAKGGCAVIAWECCKPSEAALAMAAGT